MCFSCDFRVISLIRQVDLSSIGGFEGTHGDSFQSIPVHNQNLCAFIVVMIPTISTFALSIASSWRMWLVRPKDWSPKLQERPQLHQVRPFCGSAVLGLPHANKLQQHLTLSIRHSQTLHDSQLATISLNLIRRVQSTHSTGVLSDI